MTYIKKLVMHGFKSFARRTEIPLTSSMNVIIGPNGSGKSNVTDAICFVLGRMSTKSIRAENLASLIFRGTERYKASREAMVEMVFDNSDETFSINSSEVSIKRIVRKNGSSIYKINDETRTRQEILELLAQAGIDPNGFNLVLQGEIGAMIKMSPVERRKVIEDVAGISIYETRKEKAQKELEKTEEKLKETSSILKEKNNYLKNLEEERQNALNYQKMEIAIRQCKAGILFRDIKEKQKEIDGLNDEKSVISKRILKSKEEMAKLKIEIGSIGEKITEITKKIELSTGGEQDILHRELSDLKAALAGHRVRSENYESRINQNTSRRENLVNKIKELEVEIDNYKKQSPEIKKQKENQVALENQLNELEKKRRRYYNIKTELSNLETRKEERQKSIVRFERELDIIDKTISQVYSEIKYEKTLSKAEELRNEKSLKINKIKNRLQTIDDEIIQIEKSNAVLEETRNKEGSMIENIQSLEDCPVCRSKITEEHRGKVLTMAKEKIQECLKSLGVNSSKKEEILVESRNLKKDLSNFENEVIQINYEIMKIKALDDKKEQIKEVVNKTEEIKKEIEEILKKVSVLSKEFNILKDVENDYEECRLRLKELSFIDLDLDGANISKQRDIERMKVDTKSIERDSEESLIELNKIKGEINSLNEELRKKETQERELFEKFQKFHSERNELQDRQKALETNLMGHQQNIRYEEDKENSIKLREAETKARLENFESEFKNFENEEIPQGSRESLVSRLSSLQAKIGLLGSINMKALETYNQVKQVCEAIQEKVDIIIKEKEKINEIIGEIDKKKRRTFVKTLDNLNSLFTRNFSQLSSKGEIYLQIENKQNIFEGGVDILIKEGKGRNFDITSMSGGEKTLASLSLIFAIQEYKPYFFYLFDEIDSALDKHNSELLAGLIKKYMLTGQYVIVTHNDALIEAAPVLYGVSMQDKISKVISQKL